MSQTASRTRPGAPGLRSGGSWWRICAGLIVAMLTLAAVPAALWWERRGHGPDLVVAAADEFYVLGDEAGETVHHADPYLVTGVVEEGSGTSYVLFEVPEPPAGQAIESATLGLRLAGSERQTLLLFSVVGGDRSGDRWHDDPPQLGPVLAVGAPAARAHEVAFDVSGVVTAPGRYLFGLRSPPMDGAGRIVSGHGGTAGPRLALRWGDPILPEAVGFGRGVTPEQTARSGFGTAPPDAAPSGDDGADEVAPGRPPRPVPGVGIEVGSTVQLSEGRGWTHAYDRADDQYGPVQMFRVFHSGLPPRFPGSSADVAGRTVNVSFKAAPSEIIAGDHDATLTSWFASMPHDRDIYWTYWHEPENNIANGDFTAAEYREAWRRVGWLAGQVDNDRLYPTLVLMGWSLEPLSGRDWRDYYPGSDVISVLGWDIYNFDYSVGEYSDPAVLFDRAIAVSRAEGKPWGVAEFGGRLVDGDESGQRRGAWIEANVDYLTSHDYPPLWIAWYDANIGEGEEYRLLDEPSRAAWQEFAHSQQR